MDQNAGSPPHVSSHTTPRDTASNPGKAERPKTREQHSRRGTDVSFTCYGRVHLSLPGGSFKRRGAHRRVQLDAPRTASSLTAHVEGNSGNNPVLDQWRDFLPKVKIENDTVLPPQSARKDSNTFLNTTRKFSTKL